MDLTSYLLGKQAGGGGTPNLQNKDITITENGTTNVSADAGYDGLQNVGVTTNVQPDLESKSVTITENTTTTITPTQGKDGLSSVEVTTNVSGGGDLSEYFNDTISSGGGNYDRGWWYLIKKISSPVYINISNCSFLFNNAKELLETPIMQTTQGINITNLANAFSSCPKLQKVDLSSLDLSSVTDFTNCFSNSTDLAQIIFQTTGTIDSVTSCSNMFYKIGNITSLDLSRFDFSNCVNFKSFLWLNGGNANNTLQNLTMGTNIGKGYLTTASANYNNYDIDLSYCKALTHDSLMSVINNLYDIATAGVQPQKLILGATNRAKLDYSTEISIATNKGWTVS